MSSTILYPIPGTVGQDVVWSFLEGNEDSGLNAEAVETTENENIGVEFSTSKNYHH